MNYLTLQENYLKACQYYANNISPDLCELEWVKNVYNNQNDGVNYYQVITKWNHWRKKPTYEDLMKYTLEEINDYHESMINHPKQLKEYSFFKTDTTKRDKIRGSVNGDCIFNTDSKKIEVFVDGEWKKVMFQ